MNDKTRQEHLDAVLDEELPRYSEALSRLGDDHRERIDEAVENVSAKNSAE